MEVITKDTEEVRAYFEALEEGMRYIDTVTAHFRPAMNGEVYFTGEDVCRMLHITSRTLQGYRTQRLIPYISLPGKTLYRQSDLLRMLDRCTCFLPCFLSLFSSTLRCMAARLPEIARKSELTILLVTSA